MKSTIVNRIAVIVLYIISINEFTVSLKKIYLSLVAIT